MRLDSFTALAEVLVDRAPIVLPDLPADASRRRLLPFYEAYFSNFIEGTEFTLDEAEEIVFDHVVPEDRPEDAHDILGTYQLVADPEDRAEAPREADAVIDLLRARHAIVMAARPDKHPGQFKQRDNRVGATQFVDHELVEGTLRAGIEIGDTITGAFARAVYAMFLISEIHPFTDGNGRIARIAMNAELSAAGESRIIIPTVFRNNYLMALRGATHNRRFDALVAALEFAQRYTARVDFSSRESADADLTRTNAFRDPTEADNAGIRLTLP
jgi:Fic family protein